MTALSLNGIKKEQKLRLQKHDLQFKRLTLACSAAEIQQAINGIPPCFKAPGWIWIVDHNQ